MYRRPSECPRTRTRDRTCRACAWQAHRDVHTAHRCSVLRSRRAQRSRSAACISFHRTWPSCPLLHFWRKRRLIVHDGRKGRSEADVLLQFRALEHGGVVFFPRLRQRAAAQEGFGDERAEYVAREFYEAHGLAVTDI